MKKLLLLMALMLSFSFASYAEEASYTITFNDNDAGDATSDITASAVLTYISEGSEYVSSASGISKVYKGKTGLKFSAKETNGSITLNLSEAGQVEATKVVVNAANWVSNKGVYDSASLKVNNLTAQNCSDEFANYTFAITPATKITSIKLDATKRLYVKSITVYYEDNGSTIIDPNAKEATFNFSEMGYNNKDEVSKCQSGIVTLDLAAGSNSNPPKYYTTGTGVRLYGGNTLTVSVPNGYYLTEISFTTDSSKGSSFNDDTTATAGSFSGLSWTASGQNNTVTITNGGSSDHVRIQTITVKYAEIPSGIADIEAEENGVVEYFNLQGVRVAEPANGLYIRRAGNKVEKVIVR